MGTLVNRPDGSIETVDLADRGTTERPERLRVQRKDSHEVFPGKNTA